MQRLIFRDSSQDRTKERALSSNVIDGVTQQMG
jgi:hypothetical protein